MADTTDTLKQKLSFIRARTLVSKIRKTISHPTSLPERNKHLASLQVLFPDISWIGPFPTHSEDFINHVTTKWRDLKRSLYARKSRDDYKRIMQAITQREDNFKENKGKMLKSALNRHRQAIDTTNIIYQGDFLDDPEEVKATIRTSAKKWTRKRQQSTDIDKPLWNSVYEPLTHVGDNTFDTLSSYITLEELTLALAETPNNKAAGPSKLTYECWRKADAKVHTTLLEIFNRVLDEEEMPPAWKRANIILIPKPKNWNKNVDVTRPITLIETARKIFTKVMINRMEKICRTHNVLRGNNCSVLKGTSTHGPATILSQICEDAKSSSNNEA